MNAESFIESANAEELRAAIYTLARVNPTRPIFEQVMEAIGDRRFQAARQDALLRINAAGPLGLTSREILQASRKFQAVAEVERPEVLDGLEKAGHIRQQALRPHCGRGATRNAWVAVDTGDAR